jgi:sec-independent protein translocase protein TatC
MSGDAKEMPFLDHLEELRWRIIWSLIGLAVGFGLAFWVVTQFDLFTFLQRPIQPYLNGHKLVYLHPADTFRITLSVSLALGGVIALPVIVYNAWAFLSPALYSHEKKVIIPVLAGGALLFLAGMALSFFIILPLTLRFLSGIQATSLEPMISVREYFDFALGMSLAMGAVFETPIAILALTALGIVTPRMLNRFRRHALVVCLVASAFITPGQDPFSLLALAAPLYLLYELSVVLSVIVHRRRERRAAAASHSDAGPDEASLPA